MTPTSSRPIVALVLLCLAALGGCRKGPPAIELHGAVTCNGEKVSVGHVTLVPLDDNGRVCAAPIVDGQYRIAAQGGVPLGKYRVQVDARKKTGRKVEQFNGVELAKVNEEVSIGPKDYGNQRSPLSLDVSSDFPGRYDITLPQQ
jgi:hypothetical protein